MAKDRTQYCFNNEEEYVGKRPLAKKIIEKYLKDNPDKSYDELKKVFAFKASNSTDVLLSEEDYLKWKKGKNDKQDRYFKPPFQYGNDILYINNQWGIDTIEPLIAKAKNKFGYSIEESKSGEKNSTINVVSSHNITKLVKKFGNLTFPHKNILLKGVPGTGKSKTIDNIIEKNLEMSEIPENVLRINIHSASSNSDLMQGISISTNDNNDILYAEKRGAVLKHIFKAMYKPNQPFVLVLEEIQENSLNELIGDLIYLIEKDKRTEIKLEDEQELSYDELFNKVKPTHFVELPNLVENSESNTKMIMPKNLYVFCTSNYRDDRKVIEDNLLRRFDVVEIYPQYQDKLGEGIFKSKDVSDFLEKLNESILKQFKDETHPDRYLVGHANWLGITEVKSDENKKLFYTALLKVIIEFKEIREVDFNAYVKPILQKLFKKDDGLSDRITNYLEIFYDNNEFKLDSYKLLVEKLQTEIYSDFL